jgi:hypothetical protein
MGGDREESAERHNGGGADPFPHEPIEANLLDALQRRAAARPGDLRRPSETFRRRWTARRWLSR